MDFFLLTEFDIQAVQLSLWVSGWAVICSLPLGILAAWILARFDFFGKQMLDGFLHLPLVMPPVVTGYLLLVLFGKKGVFGALLFKYLGITLAFDWKGAALAAAVMAFPLMVRSVRLSIEAIDPGLEFAAHTLGAGRCRVFFTISLPLMIPGIITGTILAFARSLGEFGATITFVSNIQGETQTLPLALYSLTQIPGGEPGAFKLCILSVMIAMAALVFSQVLSRQFAKFMKG